MQAFKVITFNFNSKEVEYYDVMPYFINCYKKCKPKDKPKTFEEFKAFVTSNGMYLFWAKCEWEIVITGFPIDNVSKKIDVWSQIESNLDLITKVLMDNVESLKRNKK